MRKKEHKTPSDSATALVEAENNEELPSDSAEKLATAEVKEATAQSDDEQLVNCGALFVNDPAEPYAINAPVRIEGTRTQVLPISHIAPRSGMTVRDGDASYAVPGEFTLDSKPIDWLRVKNPDTGKPFIG